MARLRSALLLVTLSFAFTLPSAGASAGLSPIDFALRGDGSVHAVLTSEGLFIEGESGVLFSCAGQYGAADAVLWSGRAEHGVVTGEDGAWLSTESGCHWRRTTGAVDGQRVVGSYQPSTGSDRILFAVDDPFGGTAVVATSDGGFTSELAGDLAVDGVSFLGMAGSGDTAVVGGLDEEGVFLAWWSDDGGATFALKVDSGETLSESASFAGLGAGRVWLRDGARLFGLDSEGDLRVEEPPVVSQGELAADASGALWVAAGEEGLWRQSGDMTWERVHKEPTTRVKSTLESLWVSRSVTKADAPVVLRSDDMGESWWPVWLAPATWAYPATCQSSAVQVCDGSTIALRRGLGLEVESGVSIAPAQPEAPVDSGCAARSGPEQAPLLLLLLCWVVFASRARVPSSP